MKKALLFLFSLLCITGFADTFTLDNQTPYPNPPKSKIAVQWANSAREVDEENRASIHGSSLNLQKTQPLAKTGKITLNIPKKAAYFRILAWSRADGDPDLVTNWVEITPNKTYTLDADHLVPVALMPGTGC